MNKELFIRDLRRFLADLPEEERNAAIQYYEDYFNDAGPEREQQVIEELGSPVDIARQIKQTNQDSISYGEGSAPNRDAAYPEPARASAEDGQQHAGGFSQGQGTYSQSGQNAGGWNNATAGNSTAGNWNNTTGGNGTAGNRNNAAAGNGNFGNWNNTAAGNGTTGNWNNAAAGSNGTGSWGNATAASSNSAWKTVLIILVCIFAIPVGIPVLSVIFALLVTVLALIFALVITFAATGIALILSGIVTIVASFALFPVGGPANGLLGLGAGLILLSLGGWILWAGILLCGKLFPAIFRSIWNGIKSIRKRGN